MTESVAEATGGRVLVALDTATLSMRALETAAGLAAVIGARLEGLFVENADLLHLGGLPFASEISAVTGARRGLAAEEIERALRVEAIRLERLVEHAARQAQVPWSFATARGRLVAQAVAREAELTILGAAGSVARRSATSGGSLAVFFDASPASFRALEVTGRLAAALRSELRVLVPEAAPDAAREQAQSWLIAGGRRGLAVPLQAGERALAETLRASRSELLVHALPDVAQSLRAIAALLAQLSCPLLVVR